MKLKFLIYSRKPIIFIILIFENIYNDLSIMLISFDIVYLCFLLFYIAACLLVATLAATGRQP